MKTKPKSKKGRYCVVFLAIVAVICAGFALIPNAVTKKEDIQTPAVSETATAYAAEDGSTVYMTKEITAESLVKIYDKLGFETSGNVAVKMSTGEPPNSNYLRPELIGDLVKKVDGTIVECNTAYGGSRASTAAHKQVAKDHGLSDITRPVDIMDEDGSKILPVPSPKAGTSTITENYVGAHLENYDSLICLSHFKGHAMAGYGGAIKNMSIGIGSSEGKSWIHSGGTSLTNTWGGEQDKFLEAMGDATRSVAEFLGGKVVYINVMNRLSVDCDCDGNPAEPDIHDIGILASYDPVALDQACVDLIYAQRDNGGESLVRRIESKNGLHTLEHAEEIGLGSRKYNLIDIDGGQDQGPVSMTYSGGVLSVSNLTGAAKLIHSSYEDGILSNIEILDAQNGEFPIEAKEGDMFMLWDSLDTGKPLCPAVTAQNTETGGKKTLIAYFSRAGENYAVGKIEIGNTARIANYIRERVDADTFEIVAKEPYPESYDETTARVRKEKDENACPEFLGEIENFEQYDTVFLGYPIWYGTMPMIMNTFLEKYDMSGKTIIPFSTNEGSGWGSSLTDLKSLCPNSSLLDGFSTRGQNAATSQEAVNSWLEGLGY